MQHQRRAAAVLLLVLAVSWLAEGSQTTLPGRRSGRRRSHPLPGEVLLAERASTHVERAKAQLGEEVDIFATVSADNRDRTLNALWDPAFEADLRQRVVDLTNKLAVAVKSVVGEGDAFATEIASHSADVNQDLAEACHDATFSHRFCDNLLVIYRESFPEQNVFSEEVQPHFINVLLHVLRRYVRAYRVKVNDAHANPFGQLTNSGWAGQDPFEGLDIRQTVGWRLEEHEDVVEEYQGTSPSGTSQPSTPDQDTISQSEYQGSTDNMSDLYEHDSLQKYLHAVRQHVLRVDPNFHTDFSSHTLKENLDVVAQQCYDLIDHFPIIVCDVLGEVWSETPSMSLPAKDMFQPENFGELVDGVLAYFKAHVDEYQGPVDINVGAFESAEDTAVVTFETGISAEMAKNFDVHVFTRQFVDQLSAALTGFGLDAGRIRVLSVQLNEKLQLVLVTFEIGSPEDQTHPQASTDAESAGPDAKADTESSMLQTQAATRSKSKSRKDEPSSTTTTQQSSAADVAAEFVKQAHDPKSPLRSSPNSLFASMDASTIVVSETANAPSAAPALSAGLGSILVGLASVLVAMRSL